MKKFYSLLFCFFCLLYSCFSQTAIDPAGDGGFDNGNDFTSNGWTVVNSTGNEWVVGTGASSMPPSPPNTAYISSNGNLSNYSYDNTKLHISHFYKIVTLPLNATNVTLSFLLQGNFENDAGGNLVDGLEIYTNQDITALPVPDALPGGTYAAQQFVQNSNNIEYVGQSRNLNYYAGKTFLLIFTWINNGDGIGDGPPASVDQASLTYCIKGNPYKVTGGGAFCTGSSGVGVGLASSDTAISYQLYNNSSPVGDPINGTGSALDFGPQKGVGNYTIIGTSACNKSYPMTGSVNIAENSLPIPSVGSNAPICFGITLSLNSSGGTSYSWTSSNGFNSTEQNPSIPNFTSDDAGTYTVTVTDDNHCSASATTEVTITSGDATGGTIPSTSICSGGSVVLNLSGNSNYPVRWESTTDSTSSTWDPIDNKTTTENFAGITAPTFFRAVVSDGCTNAYSDIATVSVHNYWTGTKTSDWNTTENWSDGQLPSASSCPDVFIPGGTPNQPLLGIGETTSITNLHILLGATLSVDNATMQIAGTIDNAGTFIASNGTLEFNGTSPQTFYGNLFDKNTIKNLIVSNTSLSIVNDPNGINDTLNIIGTVSFGLSNSIFTTNGNLTLKSTPDGTASIAEIPVDGSGNALDQITGNVEVERYINIGTAPGTHAKTWQYLATPTKGQSLYDSWMEGGSKTIVGYGAQFTGTTGTANGFDAHSAAPSVKYWDEAKGNWTEFLNTGEPLYNPRGYFAFIRGDRTVDGYNVKTATPTTLRSKGTILTGDQKFTVPAVTATPNNTFFSIGNPYPSAVDMTKVSVNGSGQLDHFYVWNPSKADNNYNVGFWDTYLLQEGHYQSVPSGTTGDFIQSGQAFLVPEGPTSQTSVVFTEADKVTNSSIANFRQQQVTGKAVQLITNLLALKADGSTGLADGTLQQFDKSYSVKVDGKDARKIMNSADNFSIKTSGVNLVVERRAPLTEEDTIQYNIANMAAQNYRLEFKAQGLSAEGVDGFVEDTYLNTRTPLNLEGTTDVDFAVTSDKATYAANRFRIVFKTKVVLPLKIVSVAAEQKDANIEVKWQVENEHTVKQYTVEKSIDGVNFKEADTVTAANNGDGSYQWLDDQATPGYNYYRIRIEDQSGQVTYSSVVKVLIPFGKPSIGIYPNPITDGIIHLQLLNQPKGMYGIRLLNPLGQTIAKKQIEHAGGNATENLKWDYNLAHGIYQLEVLKPDGKVQVIKVMY